MSVSGCVLYEVIQCDANQNVDSVSTLFAPLVSKVDLAPPFPKVDKVDLSAFTCSSLLSCFAVTDFAKETILPRLFMIRSD